MPRIALSEKRLRTKELAALISSGLEPAVAADEMARKYGWSRRTKSRYVDRVFAMWERDTTFDRDGQLAVAVARRNALMRGALTRTRTVIEEQVDKDGNVLRVPRSIPDPDYQAALACEESRTKLLGLSAPEKVDVFVRGVGPILHDIIEVLRAQIADTALLETIVRQIRERVEAGADAGRLPAMIEGKVISPEGDRSG